MDDATARNIAASFTLMIDNDESMHLQVGELAREHADDQSAMRDALKDFCEEACGMEADPSLPDMAREVLQTAIDSVDWWKVAGEYMEEWAEIDAVEAG